MHRNFKGTKSLNKATAALLVMGLMAGCSVGDKHNARTELRVAEINSFPAQTLVTRAQLAKQIEDEVAVGVNRERLHRRIELEEARGDLLLRELSKDDTFLASLYVRIVEASLATENITQFDNTNLFVPFALREALRYDTDGLKLEMSGVDEWSAGIHREFLYVDIPFSTTVITGEELELNTYAKYVGVNGVFRSNRINGDYTMDKKWLGVLYGNLERSILTAMARFDAGLINYSEFTELVGGIDLEQFSNRAPIGEWNEDLKAYVLPQDEIIGSIEHELTVEQMNSIVGQSRSEAAIVPSISLLTDSELQLSSFGGYNLVSRGEDLKKFGFDISKLKGTSVIRFVFETEVGKPENLSLANLYFRSLTWDNLPDMRTDLTPFPEFLEEAMASLLDAGDRIVMNNDVTGGMAGRVYRDPRETLLHGVGARGYARHRRISEIAPLEYPYFMDRKTGEMSLIEQDIDYATGDVTQHTVTTEHGRVELELNFGSLILEGFVEGKSGERELVVAGTLEYEFGQTSYLKRVGNYFLVEVTRTVMERPSQVNAVPGTWNETWMYVFELNGSDLYVVDRFRTAKIMSRDIYLYSGNHLERRLLYLSLSGDVSNETRLEVYDFHADYIKTLNSMNIDGPSGEHATYLRERLFTQDLYMLNSERAQRTRTWITDNLMRENTKTQVTGAISEVLAGVDDQVEILTLELIEYVDIGVALVLENYMLLQKFDDTEEWRINEVRNTSREKLFGKDDIRDVREKIQSLN
jgi:hypothetical protein